MSDKSLFRRNLLIIAGFHVLLITALFLSGFFSKSQQTITWLDGGGSSATKAPTPDETVPDTTPDESTPEPTRGKVPEMSRTPAPSDIVLATPTPRPSATPRTPKPETPTPTPTPKPPTPTPSITPKHTPVKVSPSPTPKKKTPSPSPKSSPKKSVSPKSSASPKHSASPAESATPKPAKTDDGDTGDEDNTPAPEHTAGVATSGTTSSKGKSGTHPGEGGVDRGGKGKKGGGDKESAAQIGWYTSMIQDRFTSRWMQPALGDDLSAIVKIRIERDGTISDVSLEKSSGNAIMDESVMTAAKSVTRIDPLPSAIEDSFYIVPIEFKLTPH